jgi:UDP-glucose 4-epimerase
LITGGNGFVGSHIADLLEQTDELGGLYDLAFDSHTANIDSSKKIAGSVLDAQRLEFAAQHCDIVLHLAAVSRVEDGEIDPDRCLKTNIEGAFNAAKVAMKRGKILVFGSSREVYGNSTQGASIDENRSKHPVSLYGITKLTSELMLAKFARTNGLQHMILRFSGVYGSIRDRRERVIPRFVNQALCDKDITVNGGSQVLDFTYVEDVAKIAVSLLSKADLLLGQSVNIVSGKGISVTELAKLVKRLANSESKIVVQPSRSFDTQCFVGDAGKLVDILGPHAKIRPLQDGLKKYLAEITERRHLLV